MGRPISPFLSIYKPQVGSIFSIFARITGIILLTVLLVVIVSYQLRETMLTYYGFYSFVFFLFKGAYSDLIAGSFLFFILLSLVYHLIFSIRYLSWSLTGGLFEYAPLNLEGLYKVSYYMLLGTVLCTLILWLVC